MIKQGIAILLTISLCGAAFAKSHFIACPTKLKVSSDGQVIKTKSGTWGVTIDSGSNIEIPTSIPGLMRVEGSTNYKLVCYDDSKSPFPKYTQNRKPIYNVYFTYKGSCKNPTVDKEKNGFHCN